MTIINGQLPAPVSAQRVVLVCGGKSGEHAISILSAANVYRQLTENGHDVTIAGITREGLWRTVDSTIFTRVNPASPDNPQGLPQILPTDGTAFVLDTLTTDFDVAFPILHGPNGEDGTVQGLFSSVGLAYVGTSVATSAVCLDKRLLKELCDRNNIPQLAYLSVHSSEIDTERKRKIVISDIMDTFDFPVFIKPPRMGSSVGISLCSSAKEMAKGFDLALQYGEYILVEQGLTDFVEIETGVLGGHNPVVSLAGETVHESDWYDFDAKYLQPVTQHCPADVPEGVHQQCLDLSRKLWSIIEGRGLCRIDFFLVHGKVFLNEINTMPGQTAQSLYPKLMESAGLSYAEVIDGLLRIAIEAKANEATWTP